MMRQLRILIILHILSGSAVVGQTQQTAMPYISEVTPPSLPPATTTPANGTFTLTILGANFPGNAVVNRGPNWARNELTQIAWRTKSEYDNLLLCQFDPAG